MGRGDPVNPKGPRLYAGIEMPNKWTDPCEVTCRACKAYHVTAADLYEAQRIAMRHDLDHWRRRIPAAPEGKR
jgi:hypothetical protein